MKSFAIAIVILLFLSVSCKTTEYVEVPVEIETVKTEYVNQLYKDSIFVHDSIDRYISGDTVYQMKYKYIYKYLNRTDTIVNEIKTEIPVEVKTIEIQEVNKIKWYQYVLIYCGIAFLILALFKLGRLSTKLFSK